MAASRNVVPIVALAVVAGFFLYGWLAVGSGPDTGGPVEVLGLLGAILLYAAILGTLVTIYLAAVRAYRAGSWLWLAAVIFIWPLSYVYALAVNRRG